MEYKQFKCHLVGAKESIILTGTDISNALATAGYLENAVDYFQEIVPLELLTAREFRQMPEKCFGGDTALKEQIAEIVATRQASNPYVDRHHSSKRGAEAWSYIHVHSDTFIFAEVTPEQIDWKGYLGASTKYYDKSRTSGPIVIDANYNAIGRFDGKFGAAPDTIVLDGSHRLHEARQRNDKTIFAWIGNKIAKRFGLKPVFQAPELEEAFTKNLFHPWGFAALHQQAIRNAIANSKPFCKEAAQEYGIEF